MSARYYLLVIAFFALVAAVAWPLGRFMARVFAGTNTLSRKARLANRARVVSLSRGGLDPGAHLEGLRDGRARLLAVHPAHHLRDPALARHPAAESLKDGRRRAVAVVQHVSELHDQHQLAVLWWRDHDELPVAGGRAHLAQLLFGGCRHCGGNRPDPRASHATRPTRSAISGSIWCACICTCWFRCACSMRCSWCRKA